MAISLVASATAAGVSQAISVARPTGSALGDRLYVVVHHNEELVNTTDNNPGNPTVKQGEHRSQIAGRGGFTVFYRTMTASEPAIFAYTLSSSQRWSIIAFTLRGMSASAFEVAPLFGQDETSAAPTCLGITTVADNAWAFAVAGTDGVSNGTFTGGPAGWTELATVNTDQPMSIYYLPVTPAGATGNEDFTTSGVGNNYTLSIFSLAPLGAPSTAWVGIYYCDLARIPDLVARGVTRFQVWGPNTTFNNAVLAAGGKVWVELTDAFPGSGYDAGILTAYVTATMGHAAVEGYLMKDEADLGNYPITLMQDAYADLKALTSHPASSVITYPFRTVAPAGRPYVDANPTVADIFAPDPYVIPYGPATQVGDHTRESVQAISESWFPARPVYTVIQSFSWGIPPPGGFPVSPAARYPTVAEMTTMGVTAREAGAQNLWIYTWRGDVEEPSQSMDQFNPSCYAALGAITDAWLAIGAQPSSLSRLIPHHGLFAGAL